MRLLQAAIFAAIGLVVCLVNAWSVEVDLARRHIHVLPVEPFIWELTSWVGVGLGLPALFLADHALAAWRSAPAKAGAVAPSASSSSPSMSRRWSAFAS